MRRRASTAPRAGRCSGRITLPLLGSTVRLSVFFSVVGSLQLFDLIMPLTGGGPSDSTQTMVTYLYNFGVTRMRFGFGSAVGVVLFLICVTLCLRLQATACAMTDATPVRTARLASADPLRGALRRWRLRAGAAASSTVLGGFKALGELAHQSVRPAQRLGVEQLLGHPVGQPLLAA